jgi:hypothetical protein
VTAFRFDGPFDQMMAGMMQLSNQDSTNHFPCPYIQRFSLPHHQIVINWRKCQAFRRVAGTAGYISFEPKISFSLDVIDCLNQEDGTSHSDDFFTSARCEANESYSGLVGLEWKKIEGIIPPYFIDILAPLDSFHWRILKWLIFSGSRFWDLVHEIPALAVAIVAPDLGASGATVENSARTRELLSGTWKEATKALFGGVSVGFLRKIGPAAVNAPSMNILSRSLAISFLKRHLLHVPSIDQFSISALRFYDKIRGSVLRDLLWMPPDDREEHCLRISRILGDQRGLGLLQMLTRQPNSLREWDEVFCRFCDIVCVSEHNTVVSPIVLNPLTDSTYVRSLSLEEVTEIGTSLKLCISDPSTARDYLWMNSRQKWMGLSGITRFCVYQDKVGGERAVIYLHSVGTLWRLREVRGMNNGEVSELARIRIRDWLGQQAAWRPLAVEKFFLG